MKTFHPRFSFYLCALLILIYGGGFVCLWYAFIPIEIKLMMSFILISSAVMVAKRYLFLTANQSIITLGVDEQQWNFSVKSGDNYQAIIMPASIVTRYIIILKLKARLTNHRFMLLLLPDSLSVEEWRQLRRQLLL